MGVGENHCCADLNQFTAAADLLQAWLLIGFPDCFDSSCNSPQPCRLCAYLAVNVNRCMAAGIWLAPLTAGHGSVAALDFSAFLPPKFSSLFSNRTRKHLWLLRIPKSHLNGGTCASIPLRTCPDHYRVLYGGGEKISFLPQPEISPGRPCSSTRRRHWIFAAGNRSSISPSLTFRFSSTSVES